MTSLTFYRRGAAILLATLLAAVLLGAPAFADAAGRQPAGPHNEQISSIPPAGKDTLAGYKLGTGDQIRLTVFGEPDLTGQFTVDGSGDINVPLIGKVKAGNLTASQLEKRITDKLSPEYIKNPSVTVAITKYRPFYIVGQVHHPGSYPYVSGMTIINAVALSGGFTYRADEDDFDIERHVGNKVKKIEARPSTQVMPGDVIHVAQRFF